MSAISTYRARHVPDMSDSALQAELHIGVRAAIREGFLRLLNSCVRETPGETAVSLTAQFQPADIGRDRQTRLQLFIGARSDAEQVRRTLETIIEQGSLAKLYALKVTDPPEFEWPFGAACDILRRETLIEPLCTEEENPLIPRRYYRADEFTPNEDGDYRLLDVEMDGLQERVVLHICVEPADATTTFRAVARVAERYNAIGRTWDDRPALCVEEDYFGAGSSSGVRAVREAELPRRRDPLADALARKAQDLRDSMSFPNLRFHFRVFAETAPVANAVAAAAADCAFRDGNYVLQITRRGEPGFDDLTGALRDGRVACVPSLGSRAVEMEPTLYRELDDVAHLATPEELAGAFRWPEGGAFPPHCIRQSTDPKADAVDMITLAYDYRIAVIPDRTADMSVPRGTREKDLFKSGGFFGKSGSGKTAALIYLMLQLYMHGIPFTFFAPIRGEHLNIKRHKNHADPVIRGLANDLQIHAPGRDDVSPFQFNPLIWNRAVQFHEHIEGLLECFKGAISFFPALEGVLRDALYCVYRQYPDPTRPPVILDVLVAARKAFGEMGYRGELLDNLGGAIEARLRPLCTGTVGNVFNAGINNPPMEKMLTGYHIIQMDALNETQIALFMLFYLKTLQERLRHK